MNAIHVREMKSLTPRALVARLCFGRGRSERKGGAVLEAALVMFLLTMILIFPAMEFGYFFYVKHTLQGAAREGARAGIPVSAINSDVTTAVSNSMSAAGFAVSTYTVAIRDSTDSSNLNVSGLAAGTPVLVKVSSTWGSIGLPRLGIFNINSAHAVVGKTVMRKEG
jgi:Flp pilus assembly protein TadG